MNMPLRPAVPRLEPGDRLTRDEFERRYEAMPHVKKAELIEGEVFMPSPVSWEFHGSPHVDIAGWLAVYKASTPGTDVGDNSTARLDTDNEPQPDVALIVRPEHGGRVTFDDKGMLTGSPDLVAEVSASTASIDLNRKLNVYRRNQVTEYVVWRVYDKQLDWFRLIQDKYVLLTPDESGVVHSQVFPGLRLAVQTLLAGDLATVLAELRKGIETSEHVAFVERLRDAKISK